MGLIDFNIDSEQLQDADGYKQRAKFWIKRHQKISIATLILGFVLLITNTLPTGFLAVLPFDIGRYLLIAMIAEFPAFYAARYIKKKTWKRPIDDIYECNIGEEQEEKHFIYKTGLLREEFEFVPHDPITWTNHNGNQVYKLLKIDEENNVAYTSFFGDLHPHELQRTRENWEKQQAWEKNAKEKVSEIAMMIDEITEEASYHVTNRLYRKGYKATHPEVAEETINSINNIADAEDEEKDKDMIDALRQKIGIDDRDEIEKLPGDSRNGRE